MALDFWEKKILSNEAAITVVETDLSSAASNITDLAGVGRTTETVKTNADNIADNTAALAERSNYLDGTTQTVTLNVDGSPATVVHTDAGSNVVRTDTFSYADNLITEVRTLAGGGAMTIVSHLDTLVTEVS